MRSYEIHKIGWKQFEDLCITTLHHVFGSTVTPFAQGKDGGRDAFFSGLMSQYRAEQEIIKGYTDGKVVFQFKHTLKPNDRLKYSIIQKEIDKLNRLINEDGIDHYVVLTNYSVVAEREAEIRKNILSEVKGLKSCSILGKEWFDRIIDQNVELKRIVPRLYGIGDLSQIIDSRIIEQSKARIENWSNNMKSFVVTSFYEKTFESLKRYNFVFLIGEPQSGKTSIAQNICLSLLEQDSKFALVSITLKDFQHYYNPNDCKKIYFFDDVFGEQSVYEPKIQELNEMIFSQLHEAIERGAIVIFTSRDYIFNELKKNPKLKRCTRTFPLLFDEQSIVKVEGYSKVEREKILYKHIKYGDISKEKKTKIKPFLKEIAMQNNFTPELARRLADTNFSRNVEFSAKGVQEFFNKPIQFLQDVFGELDETEQAAIILVLLKEGQLPVIIRDEHLDKRLEVFDIKVLEITKALQHMKNSLVKQDIMGNRIVWKPYHPSMKEAIVQYIKNRDEMIEIFIGLADFKTLVDETSVEFKEDKLFVSEYHQWELLSKRLFETIRETKEDSFDFEDYYLLRIEKLSRFFFNETNEDYLRWFESRYDDSQEVWEQLIINSIYNQLHTVDTYKFANKLIEWGLLSNHIKEQVIERIARIGRQTFDLTFMEQGPVRKILGEDNVELLLEHYEKHGIELAKAELEHLCDNFEISSEDMESELENHFSYWFCFLKLMQDELDERGLLTVEMQGDIENLIEEAESWKSEWLQDYEENTEDEKDRLVNLLVTSLQKMKIEKEQNNLTFLMNSLIDELTEKFMPERSDAVEYIQNWLFELHKRTSDDEWANLSYILSQSIVDSDDIFSDVDE